jgi:hypothetical protein
VLAFIDKSKQYLWAFVELAFAAVLALMLIYLLLGPASGPYVVSVADNVTKFAGGVPTPSLIGLAIVLALIWLIMGRMKDRY